MPFDSTTKDWATCDTTPNRRMPRQWRIQVLLGLLRAQLAEVLDRLSTMPDQSTPEGDRLFGRMDVLDDRIDAVEALVRTRRPPKGR